MNRTLFSMIYSIAGTVLIGVLIVIALVLGYDEIIHVWISIGVGAVLALPIAMAVDKKMEKMTESGDS